MIDMIEKTHLFPLAEFSAKVEMTDPKVSKLGKRVIGWHD